MDAIEVLYRIGWSLLILGAAMSAAFETLRQLVEDDDWRGYAIIAAIFAFAGLLMILTLYIWTGEHEWPGLYD